VLVRRCKDCGTPLSRYNKGDQCFVHASQSEDQMTSIASIRTDLGRIDLMQMGDLFATSREYRDAVTGEKRTEVVPQSRESAMRWLELCQEET
jgi:hypothetical protein